MPTALALAAAPSATFASPGDALGLVVGLAVAVSVLVALSVRGPGARVALAGAAALAACGAAAAVLLARDPGAQLLAWTASAVALPLVLRAAAHSASDRAGPLRAAARCAPADLLVLAGLALLGGRATAPWGAALAAAGASARLGAFPFHRWVVEAAEAATGAAAAFAAGAAKLGAAGLLVWLARAHGPLVGPPRAVLLGVGGLSAGLGLVQGWAAGPCPRGAAHLSVAHGGAVLVAFALLDPPVALAAAVAGAAALVPFFLLARARDAL